VHPNQTARPNQTAIANGPVTRKNTCNCESSEF
jgi:hypothetical protein